MKLNINSIITKKRKERGITQKELADFIGVSKSSVSKWETRQTYPDINMLPLLAAYFDVSIDELLNYDAQLSTEEIQQIYASLQKSFETTPGEEILETITSLIKKYYSCYPFILQMGMFVVNHFDLLPGKDHETKLNMYMQKAQELFAHVKDHSNEPKLIEKALAFEAYVLLALQDSNRVLEVLGESTPVYYSVETLIAMAHQLEGNLQAANEVMQCGIIQSGSISLNLFTNYLPLTFNDTKRFKKSCEKGLMLIDVYEMEKTNPFATINFIIVSIIGLAKIKDEDALLNALERYLKLIKKIDTSIILQSNDYFNKIDPWIDNFDLGNQLPRNPRQTKEDLITTIIDDSEIANYRNNKRFKSIFNQLDLLRKNEVLKK